MEHVGASASRVRSILYILGIDSRLYRDLECDTLFASRRSDVELAVNHILYKLLSRALVCE